MLWDAVVGIGLIPAHAGKTGGGNELPGRAGAHPRACGENGRRAKDQPFTAGSSPRMRGKHPKSQALHGSARLIPAHAGKTNVAPFGAFWWKAHPRACGENGSFHLCFETLKGSSPRMRGKLNQSEYDTISRRLIPAHAGKTFVPVASASGKAAHPRACGENSFSNEAQQAATGSSPRMRGKPFTPHTARL